MTKVIATIDTERSRLRAKRLETTNILRTAMVNMNSQAHRDIINDVIGIIENSYGMFDVSLRRIEWEYVSSCRIGCETSGG